MAASPAHRQFPSHRVIERRLSERVTAGIHGETFADSRDVIRVDEDGSPSRYYFPRADVQTASLERSASTTHCPFKGTAQYFHLLAGGTRLVNAIWSYEEPYDEHLVLKDRLAFYDNKYPQIQLCRHA